MKLAQNIETILTEDGSHTLRLPELDETYHSTHGAIQESQHIYIATGLFYWLAINKDASQLKILEFGFGTGLNVLLTASRVAKAISVEYDTLEKYPLSKTIATSLNYGELLQEGDLFKLIHSTPWNKQIVLGPAFKLHKMQVDFCDFNTTNQYNLIYFDAFAPSKQPELWSKEILLKCYNLLEINGVFITYSAKGQLKRDLKAVGFSVESLPGPPGKFEITRAIKPS